MRFTGINVFGKLFFFSQMCFDIHSKGQNTIKNDIKMIKINKNRIKY